MLCRSFITVYPYGQLLPATVCRFKPKGQPLPEPDDYKLKIIFVSLVREFVEGSYVLSKKKRLIYLPRVQVGTCRPCR